MRRFWLEFADTSPRDDIWQCRITVGEPRAEPPPEPPSRWSPWGPRPSRRTPDGGYYAFELEAGVTARDLAHALRIVEAEYAVPLPPLVGVTVNPDLSEARGLRGVPVWPGVWHPPANLRHSRVAD